MGGITVVNHSPNPIFAFVSKYSNNSGKDDWFPLAPGESDKWDRNGWELVAFRDRDNTFRRGVYVRVDSTVNYYGSRLHPIQVSHPR